VSFQEIHEMHEDLLQARRSQAAPRLVQILSNINL
jgi:hypothetical protein